MDIQDKIRRSLMVLIALVGILAATWSAAMLVGGFRAAGQLDSVYNPLGEGVLFIAAAAIIGGTAIFYYCLGSRRRTSRFLLVVSGTIVAALTLFASATQLTMVEDAAMGDQYVKGTAVKIRQAWQQAGRIDHAITDRYVGQVDHFKQRMAEEAKTGIGPKYRAAERAHNRLRAEYGSVLGRTAKAAAQGKSLSDDAEGVRGYVTALRGKVRVYERFTANEGLAGEDFGSRLDRIEASLDTLGGGGWIDRRSLVYERVMEKIWAMVASFGLADLGFTLNALLSITPDLIQILCTCLIGFLRPPEDHDGGLGTEAEGWSPFDKVWGDTVADAAE